MIKKQSYYYLVFLCKLMLSFLILLFISCFQPGGNQLSNSRDAITHSNFNSYQVNTTQLSKFNWAQLRDTAKYSIRYVQLNFLNFPDDSTIGQDILEFTDAKTNKSFLLTGRQEYQLQQLINDTTNFSDGACGTFHLNAGILVFDKDKICATINIGCGYNQWNFSSDNPNAKYGVLSERGFARMQQLLDDINLNSKR